MSVLKDFRYRVVSDSIEETRSLVHAREKPLHVRVIARAPTRQEGVMVR